MLLKAFRNALGYIIVFVDWISRPKPIARTSEQQNNAQKAMHGLSLYQLYACPFCVKTRRAIHRLNVNLDIKDIKNKENRRLLVQQGKPVKVPCLRIEEDEKVLWMHESNDIIDYLQKRVLLEKTLA